MSDRRFSLKSYTVCGGISNRSLHGKSTFVWAAITCMLRGRDRVYMGRDNAKYQKR